MTTCSVPAIENSRNKWENHKIKKYYTKKHKGVASRQHRFPKLSSNSARPWVRNWAKISKLEYRIKHKNHCNAFCNDIQKYSQKFENEMESTAINNTSYTDDQSVAAATFPIITLNEYLDPILSEYENDYDEFLQIAIEQSFETYSVETISKNPVNSSNDNKHRKIDELLPKLTPKNKDCMKQETENETIYIELDETAKEDYFKMDVKVTINLHNILGINYDNDNIYDYTTQINQIWRKNYRNNMKESYIFTTLPYKLRGCNMEICIDDKNYSFCFIQYKKTEYSVMIDYRSYSFQVTDHEESAMDECNQIIPIYIEKRNHTSCPFSNYNDNRRLFQIAQKCFEKIILFNQDFNKKKKKKKKSMDYFGSTDMFSIPQWKYNDIHQDNNSFIPSVCKLHHILSEYIPIKDILNGVLFPYIGYAQFESVVVTSTINIKNEYKEELMQHMEGNKDTFDKEMEIELKCGTHHGFKYIEPFSKCITFIPSNTMYTYDAIKYDGKEVIYPDYSKQRRKKCYRSWQRYLTYSGINNMNKNNYSKHNGLNEEGGTMKDIRRKTRGKKRRRRNRTYIIKPKIKHRRRKERKKKYKKNVYHGCGAKQKRLKSKISKGIHQRRYWSQYSLYGRRSKKGDFGVIYRPSYCLEYEKMRWCTGYWNMDYRWNYNGERINNRRTCKTNKRFLAKIGRKNKRLF